MPHFKELIETEYGVGTIYFNRIYTVDGINYHVSVRNGFASHYFMMHDVADKRNFFNIEKKPDWIISVKEELENAIVKRWK